jgi:hypothetical protein
MQLCQLIECEGCGGGALGRRPARGYAPASGFLFPGARNAALRMDAAASRAPIVGKRPPTAAAVPSVASGAATIASPAAGVQREAEEASERPESAAGRVDPGGSRRSEHDGPIGFDSGRSRLSRGARVPVPAATDRPRLTVTLVPRKMTGTQPHA